MLSSNRHNLPLTRTNIIGLSMLRPTWSLVKIRLFQALFDNTVESLIFSMRWCPYSHNEYTEAFLYIMGKLLYDHSDLKEILGHESRRRFFTTLAKIFMKQF